VNPSTPANAAPAAIFFRYMPNSLIPNLYELQRGLASIHAHRRRFGALHDRGVDGAATGSLPTRASLDARPSAASRTGATGGQGTDDEIRAATMSTLS
jgi:hypothetical protein